MTKAAERALEDADASWSTLAMRLAERLARKGQTDDAAAVYRRLAQLTRDAKMRVEAEKRLKTLENRTDRKNP